MVSAEIQPTDSQKYERVHNDGRRERSSANSSRSMREEYPLNCWTIKCGEYVGFDLTKIWIWSDIVSISTISTSISSAFLRMSSFKRNSIFGDSTFLRYFVHQIKWYPRLYTHVLLTEYLSFVAIFYIIFIAYIKYLYYLCHKDITKDDNIQI